MISNATVIHYIDDWIHRSPSIRLQSALNRSSSLPAGSTLGVNEGLELGLHTSLKDGPPPI